MCSQYIEGRPKRNCILPPRPLYTFWKHKLDDREETPDPPFTPELLRLAYAQGFFPMPDPDSGEILWFHPDPRAVLPLDGFHCSKSLQRTLKRKPFTVSVDRAFAAVMAACGARAETWITDEFKAAYGQLHAEGTAHSLEVWLDDRLVGGVYGVALGGAFFAESMFHRETDASKVALYHLVSKLKAAGFGLLEVQFLTPHLVSLGAIEIPRTEYLARLAVALRSPATFG
jgi:leucyl/phenylalanyl-tRNA--protein transferase